MDLEQIQNLTNEQKQRYLDLERVFDSPGWQNIEEYAKARFVDATQRLINAKSWDENRIFTGAREALALFVNLREGTENEFAALAVANVEAQRQQDEDEHE